MPRRRSALASAMSTARASTTMATAGRPSASTSGWNWTGALVPVNADRSIDEPTVCGSATAQTAPATTAASTAGMASVRTRLPARS